KEQNPEGKTIEYKADFPSDLEKSISAMANTYGGIILIGVEANQTTNTPILPIKGRELTKGLEEKITSICLRKIYPPYFPSVKVCPFKNEKGEDKCVVFIKVHESDQTPHAINNDTDVYLRIRSQNEPLKKGTLRKATLEEIDWLKDKRKKAIDLRESLLVRADERYQYLSRASLSELELQRFRKCFLVPIFCSQQLISSYDLFGCLDKLKGFEFDHHIDNLQMFGNTAHGVLYYFRPRQGELGHPKDLVYEEYSTYGLVLRKEPFWESSYKEMKNRFSVDSLLYQIYQTFKLGLLFYSAIGYVGILKVGIDVSGLRNREIILVDESVSRIEESLVKNKVENEFSYRENILSVELEEKLDSTIIEIYRQFLFACGLGRNRNKLDQLSAKHYNLTKDRRYQFI
ncbi:ATP-binding protein, partial [bacterium]|nr:ATP-binding protein [bacterium]